MKKNTLAFATALALGSVLSVAHANEAAQSSVEQVTPKAITSPITQKVDVVDDYFGTKVSDPYRWLEDDLSLETAEWVKAQNAVTFDYLSKIPYREQIEERITKLMDYEKQSQPFKEGKFTYFYKNDGLQNQDVLYRQLGDGDAEIFLDPNTFSEDGTTSLAGVSFSRDGSLVAYSISEGGSDWRKVIVLETETKKPVGETLVDIKFSGISWLGNQGFYYSSYDKPQGVNSPRRQINTSSTFINLERSKVKTS